MNAAELRDLRSFPGAEETFPLDAKTSVFEVDGMMFPLTHRD